MQERITAELTESERSGLWLLAIESKPAEGFIGYCGLTAGAATEAEPEIASRSLSPATLERAC